ncbi:MAG: hypothetical protein IKM43_02445 [Clostridia bacterium]|nr:hypothetical protein [Clostridia bacterium]
MKGKQVVNFLAYISIAFIALALILGKLLGWLINPNVLNALNLIAQIIAYTITAIYAFSFAKGKKSKGWMIAYVIFVILIVVFTILNTATIFKA